MKVQSLSLIFVLLVCANAWAGALDLLGVEISPADHAFLETLAPIKDPSLLKTKILEQYPDLRIHDTDFEDEFKMGQYLAAYEQPENFQNPSISLIHGASKEVIVHELIHYLFDQARLNTVPEQTIRQQRTYRSHRKQLFEELLQNLRVASTDQARYLAKAALAVDGLESLNQQYGEEVEVIVYLLTHQKSLGLDGFHLSFQVPRAEEYLKKYVLSLTQYLEDFEDVYQPKPVPQDPKALEFLLSFPRRLQTIDRRANELVRIVNRHMCEAALMNL